MTTSIYNRSLCAKKYKYTQKAIIYLPISPVHMERSEKKYLSIAHGYFEGSYHEKSSEEMIDAPFRAEIVHKNASVARERRRAASICAPDILRQDVPLLYNAPLPRVDEAGTSRGTKRHGRHAMPSTPPLSQRASSYILLRDACWSYC